MVCGRVLRWARSTLRFRRCGPPWPFVAYDPESKEAGSSSVDGTARSGRHRSMVFEASGGVGAIRLGATRETWPVAAALAALDRARGDSSCRISPSC